MQEFKLYMMLLGAKPAGRHTEQHDIFFGIGTSLKDCLPDIFSFWPETKKKVHIDAWRDIQQVNGFKVQVVPRSEDIIDGQFVKLFFINLGGYRPAEFEEFHYKMIIAAVNKDAAIAHAKKTAFFLHCDSPHVDDKYGVDVDDIYEITDILPFSVKNYYTLVLTPTEDKIEDEIHLGYLKVDQLE
jgi:hypothetical protein